MFTIKELLSPTRTLADQTDDSKKHLLHHISKLICHNTALDPQAIFEAFTARERIGHTSIGHGIAIPHIRFANVDKPIGALIHLTRGIIFSNADQKPIDLIFALVVPENFTDEHTQILSLIATKFRKPTYRNDLRLAHDSTKLYDLATQD